MPHRHPKQKYQLYWHENLQYLAVLLGIWSRVSCLFGILLVDELDQIRIRGFGQFLPERFDGLNQTPGSAAYTDGSKSTLDVFYITAALMVGTAGLPHVISV